MATGMKYSAQHQEPEEEKAPEGRRRRTHVTLANSTQDGGGGTELARPARESQRKLEKC